MTLSSPKHLSQTDNKGTAQTPPPLITRAPLIEHLFELRRRVFILVSAWAFSSGLCFYYAQFIYNILLIPYLNAVRSQQNGVQLIYTAPQEGFLTHLKLALFGGFMLAFPLIAAQIYLFIAPGLYRREKWAVLPFLIGAPLLFLAGAALVFFGIMPLALRFFLSFEQTGAPDQAMISLLPQVSAYLQLTITLICAFGLVFQLPVVLSLLAKLNMVSAAFLRQKRKYALVLIFLIAAFLTPPDMITQIGLALPALALYELSILCVHWIEKVRIQNA